MRSARADKSNFVQATGIQARKSAPIFYRLFSSILFLYFFFFLSFSLLLYIYYIILLRGAKPLCYLYAWIHKHTFVCKCINEKKNLLIHFFKKESVRFTTRYCLPDCRVFTLWSGNKANPVAESLHTGWQCFLYCHSDISFLVFILYLSCGYIFALIYIMCAALFICIQVLHCPALCVYMYMYTIYRRFRLMTEVFERVRVECLTSLGKLTAGVYNERR